MYDIYIYIIVYNITFDFNIKHVMIYTIYNLFYMVYDMKFVILYNN